MNRSKRVIILVGICGTGKSPIGRKVANRLEIPFYDADFLKDFDKTEEKNSEDWLNSIQELIETSLESEGCVIACSLLKKEQRLQLNDELKIDIDWVFLHGSYNEIHRKLSEGESERRTETELKKDYEQLEIPKRALTIDVGNSEEESVDTILKYLARKYY